jgi:hypothetical protein
MPRRIRDFVLAALGAVILVGALALIDERVPRHVASVVQDVKSGEWLAQGSLVNNVVTDVTGSRAVEDVFLLAMLVAGVVLVILMVRT